MIPLFTEFPHQDIAASFLLSTPATLNFKGHHVLGDDGGLGKTGSVALAIRRGGLKSALFVVPAPEIIQTTWARTLVDWGVCTMNDIFIVPDSITYIPATKRFIIVSYNLGVKPNIAKQLRKRRFDCVVADEIQNFAHLDSQRSKVYLSNGGGKEIPITALGKYKWGLSGTWAMNRTMDVFPVLKTWAPEVIRPHDTKVKFGLRYCAAYFDGREWNYKGASHTDELKSKLVNSGFFLRREFREVFPDFPEPIERDLYITLAPMRENETNTEVATLARLIGEAKAYQAVDYIKYQLQTSPKIFVVAHHKEVIARLQEGLKEFGAVVVNGDCTKKQKAEAYEAFLNSPDCRVLIGQITSAGTGIDGLQKVCHHMVQVEIDWTKTKEEQALWRVSRLGQEHDVLYDRLIAQGTFDEVKAGCSSNKDRILKLLFDNMREVQNMDLIQLLTSIDGSLKQLVAAQNGGGAAEEKAGAKAAAGKATGKTDAKAAKQADAPAATQKETAASAKQPSADDVVQAALAAVQRMGGTDAAKEVIKAITKDLGADVMKNIAAEKRTEFISRCQSAELSYLEDDFSSL